MDESKSGEPSVDPPPSRQHADKLHDRLPHDAAMPTESGDTIASSDHDPRGGSKGSKPGSEASGSISMGQYDLLRELGRGGMGVVYLARQRSLQRMVAIKMILAGQHSSPESRKRFLREANALARLQHENIVRVYDMGDEAGQAFYAMEYVEGTDLQRAAPLPARRAAEIVETIARAVAFAHRQGIIHRDLKPANILLDQRGNPKVSDFGLAKVVDAETFTEKLTLNDQLLGTAPYMAPEQAEGGAGSAGIPADVYALGAILYHALAGQAPFLGKSAFEVLKRVQTEEPWPLRQLTATIPADLETICLKCLAKSPLARYASADDLADDLRRFLQDEPIHARPASGVQRVVRLARRSRWIQLGAVALLLMISWAGIAWRNHLLYDRLTKLYFGAIQFTREGPVGLKPLSSETVQKRAVSFCLERHGWRGPVHAVSAINANGHLVANASLSPLLDVFNDEPDVAVIECEHDRQGNIQKFRAFDVMRKPLWSFLFTDPPRSGFYMDPQGYERSPSGTGAVSLEFFYNDMGLITSVQFSDRRGRPQPNSEGAYGIRLNHDSFGQPTRIDFLDDTGRPALVYGCAQVRMTYDDQFQVTEVSMHDATGALTFCQGGFAGITTSYDQYGNEVQMIMWGVDRQPISTVFGYAGIRMAYNDQGYCEQKTYLGIDGAATFAATGMAIEKYEYDSAGRVTRETYLDPTGHPITIHEGYAHIQRRYDDGGKIATESMFGPDEQPAVTSSGVHRIDYQYDEFGNRHIEENFDVSQTATLNSDGWHRRISNHDRQGHLLEQRHEDIRGRPTYTSDGYTAIRQEVDDQGNVTKVTYLGEDGQPVLNSDGYAETRSSFDGRGKAVDQFVYDHHGQPTLHNEGFHGQRSTHDERGFETERVYLGLDQKPCWHKDGFAFWKRTVDDRGNALEESYFDPDGRLTVSGYGVAKVRYTYNHLGKATDVRFFDAEDRPCAAAGSFLQDVSDGNLSALDDIARFTAEYDNHGKARRLCIFGTDGRPLLIAGLVAGFEYEYDHRGLQIRTTFLDGQGQPVNVAGIATERSVFDPQGRSIESSFWTSDEQPAIGWEGFHRMVSRYDARGNQVEFWLYGVAQELTTHSQGHSHALREYDDRGHLIKESLFDAEDRPVVGALGYAVFTAKYDRYGNRTTEAYYDGDGRAMLGNEGYHRFESQFERGVVRETQFFGADHRPILSSHGYATVRYDYNERMQKIAEMTFDVDGRPIAVDGYVRQTFEYDQRGNVRRRAFFDDNDKLVISNDGYAVLVQEFDAYGRLLTSECFDEHDQPIVRLPGGFFREVIRYDSRGNERQHQYYGTDGKPIVLPNGFAEVTVQYDDYGRRRSRAYYDKDGQRLDVKVTVVETPSDEDTPQSLKVGDIVVRLDGEPISDQVQLQYLAEYQASTSAVVVVQRGDERSEFAVPTEVVRKAEFEDVLPKNSPSEADSQLDSEANSLQE